MFFSDKVYRVSNVAHAMYDCQCIPDLYRTGLYRGFTFSERDETDDLIAQAEQDLGDRSPTGVCIDIHMTGKLYCLKKKTTLTLKHLFLTVFILSIGFGNRLMKFAFEMPYQDLLVSKVNFSMSNILL